MLMLFVHIIYFLGYDNEYQPKSKGSILTRKNNTLPIWGNERTMNLNTLILTNIQSSHYFKGNFVVLNTYVYDLIDILFLFFFF